MMKKAMLTSAVCLLAMATGAQTITTEAVYKTYREAVESENSEYVYNADIEDGIVTAQYIYQKTAGRGRLADCQLTPKMMHRYEYDAAGRLTSRTTLSWDAGRERWKNGYRLDYSYDAGLSTVEYRKWNKRKQQFDDAAERMVYELLPGAAVGQVCFFQKVKDAGERKETSEPTLKLVYAIAVPSQLFFGDHLLTQHP